MVFYNDNDNHVQHIFTREVHLKSFTSKIAIMAVVLVTLAGCSSNKKNPVSPNGGGNNLIFIGTVNGATGNFSGWVSLLVNDTTVTGTFKLVTPDTATYALTGHYDTTTKALIATGGGFTFTGVYNGVNSLQGAVTGTEVGTFVIVKDDNNTAVAFNGTFSGDNSGIWNFTINGAIIAGSFTTTSGSVGALDGTISGNAISIANPGGGTTPLAIGTRNNNNVSGTWNDGQGHSGSWIGTRSN
jgi:hypothetical protein